MSPTLSYPRRATQEEERDEDGLQALSFYPDEVILGIVSDPLSRAIVTSTVAEAKSVEEMSEENRIPLSSCYRRVKELVDERVLLVERITITAAGKRYATYRSAIKGIRLDLSCENLEVHAIPNGEMSDKLRSMWLSIRYNRLSG